MHRPVQKPSSISAGGHLTSVWGWGWGTAAAGGEEGIALGGGDCSQFSRRMGGWGNRVYTWPNVHRYCRRRWRPPRPSCELDTDSIQRSEPSHLNSFEGVSWGVGRGVGWGMGWGVGGWAYEGWGEVGLQDVRGGRAVSRAVRGENASKWAGGRGVAV